MKKELEEKIVNDFPKLFQPEEVRNDPRQSCMAFGFGCDDGWYDLLYNLCGCIQHYIDHCHTYVNGEKIECPQVTVTQIKEKFGGLRFYYYGGDDKVSGMVHFAESLSYTTCEITGGKGRLRKGGWIRTLCDEKAKELGYKEDDGEEQEEQEEQEA